MLCSPGPVFDGNEGAGPVFMFCPPALILDDTDDVGSRFHVLCSPKRFRQYGGRQGSFSYFALPKPFPTVTRASGPAFILMHSDPFSAIPWVRGPVFMFCAPRSIFGGTEGVRTRFHVLRSRNHFRRYQGRRVPFSCFVLEDSF
jgi:hypothetical protein